MGAAAAAGGASIASAGLSMYGSVAEGEGKKAGLDFQADRAKRAAEFGKVQAELTDTQFREELNTTLANIDVIRAAGRIDPSSPTSIAIGEREREVSDRQRLASVGSIKAQVSEDLASADYLREAGEHALKMSYVNAGVKGLSAVSKGFSGMSKGG